MFYVWCGGFLWCKGDTLRCFMNNFLYHFALRNISQSTGTISRALFSIFFSLFPCLLESVPIYSILFSLSFFFSPPKYMGLVKSFERVMKERNWLDSDGFSSHIFYAFSKIFAKIDVHIIGSLLPYFNTKVVAAALVKLREASHVLNVAGAQCATLLLYGHIPQKIYIITMSVSTLLSLYYTRLVHCANWHF